MRTRSSGLSSRSVVSSPRKPPAAIARRPQLLGVGGQDSSSGPLHDEVDVPRPAADVERREVAHLAAHVAEAPQARVDLVITSDCE
jgi:hypothetical protein